MPLVRIDAIEGRSKDDIKNLLDAVHRAIVSAFAVPQRDRYQIYQEHSESTLVVEDTGLGIERTRKVVVITLTSRPRKQDSKQMFFKHLCRELKTSCDIEPSDVIVSIVTNSDPDWSFGDGNAQLVTGEL
jgi:hypothetical protein